MSVARRAFGFARVSAIKGSLRRPDRVAGHAVAPAPEAVPDQSDLVGELFGVYRTIGRTYRELTGVVDTLLSRHELANAIVVLRALVRGRPARDAALYWRDLGRLSTIDRGAALEATSPLELARCLRGSRLAPIEPLIRMATGESLAAASLAAERQVWKRIDAAFLALPRAEHSSRRLGVLLVLEQDINWLQRAPAAASIDPVAAARATCALAREMSRARLDALARWSSGRGPLAALLPGRWTWARDAADGEALAVAIRRARRRLCERAFTDRPFSLAVPVAVLLLKEEELRALTTAREAGDQWPAAAARAQAASLFGNHAQSLLAWPAPTARERLERRLFVRGASRDLGVTIVNTGELRG